MNVQTYAEKMILEIKIALVYYGRLEVLSHVHVPPSYYMLIG